MDNEFRDVCDFHRKFGFTMNLIPVHLTKRRLRERLDFLREELDELSDGVETQNMEMIADALIDLVYVAKGTAIQLGLPWKELWDDVQRANMAKIPGRTHRNHNEDVTKPVGWIGPKTNSILVRNGYQENDFLSDNGETIDEAKCLGDL